MQLLCLTSFSKKKKLLCEIQLKKFELQRVTLTKSLNYTFRYLAAKSEADHYAREMKREQEEIVAVPETGKTIVQLNLNRPTDELSGLTQFTILI